jgi:hypothetical protein
MEQVGWWEMPKAILLCLMLRMRQGFVGRAILPAAAFQAAPSDRERASVPGKAG